jgi:hypothetical protein
MCGGASSEQKQINKAQTDFYNNLTSQYNTIFGQNQAITGALTSAFTPILQAGPGQAGYTPAETNALNTSTTENIASNYAQAQKATAQILAARGGGDTVLPSSVDANALAKNTNLAAQQTAAAQNQITSDSYNVGRQNWLSAAQVLGSTAGLIDPTKYASAATTSGSTAAEEANKINDANNSLWKTAIGALGNVAGQAVGGFNFSKLWGGFGKASAPTGYATGGYD